MLNLILRDEDFELTSVPFDNPRLRFGARGIILNEKNEVAILYKKKKKEYKLVGGGIDDLETPKEAFYRETLEETGCLIKNAKFIGNAVELKSQDNFIQISYLYVACVSKDTFHTSFTFQEKGEGAELLWLSMEKALEKIEKSESKLVKSEFDGEKSIYHSKFIVRRDYNILKYFLECEKKY